MEAYHRILRPDFRRRTKRERLGQMWGSKGSPCRLKGTYWIVYRTRSSRGIHLSIDNPLWAMDLFARSDTGEVKHFSRTIAAVLRIGIDIRLLYTSG